MITNVRTKFGITLEEAVSNRIKTDIQPSLHPEYLSETYVCSCCQFVTHWVYGAADKYEDVCDACFCLLTEKENEEFITTV
ncbi:MAG: hypothetical protein J7647_30980 [Cyanobacteria bacterium SBLK]|nr:hypothetical protein [Cyanobacteria bacterium SBLK]